MAQTAYTFSSSLEEVRARLVWRLSFGLIGFGILAAWYVIVRRDLPFAGVWIPFLLVVFSRGVQVLLDKNPVLARHLFVYGMTAHLIVALAVFRDPSLFYLAVLSIVVSAMLISHSGLVSAAIFVALAALLNVIGGQHYPLLELATMLGLAAGSSWVIAYTLFTVVHWYSAMQLHSQQLLEVTRDHRAELGQALKSLQAAYETQKHIQLELTWARQHAEDARRLKEQFAANISHELWTPLNLILGFSEVMYLSPHVYGDMTWTPGLRRDVYQIYRNSQHLLGLIGDILDLSRFEMTGFDISPEPTSLAPFLKDTLEIVENSVQGRSVHFILSVSDDLPLVEVDNTRIRQVLLNLLNNACRFAEEGVIELAAHRAGQEVVISVRDTGPGIPADKLPYLFDEFYQVNPSLKRSRSGAGLGLAISKRFVEAHHGRIWVESQQGVGSCFFFALPVQERGVDAQRLPSGGERPASVASRKLVIVVGAEGAALALLKRALKDCDVVQERGSHDLADRVLTLHPRMIILNTHPGQDPAQRQTLIDTGVPVVECALPNNAEAAEALGIQACLTQPVSSQTLLSEIGRVGDVRDILIASSDRASALLIERLLEMSDRRFSVRRVYDADEGAAALGEHRPDLVLLDTGTPQEDSLRLLEYLRADRDFERLPVIVLAKNVWRAELQSQNPFVVHHRDGFYPTEILKFLNAVFDGLAPRYYSANGASLAGAAATHS